MNPRLTIEEQIILQYAVPHHLDKDPFLSLARKAPERWNKVNWDQVLELALSHDVFPAVYQHLEKSGWEQIPDESVAKFRRQWGQHLARNIILSDELNRILGLFDREGIKAIPLKGVLLAGLFYPEISLRSFSDLDIWVRAADISRAGQILKQIGYREWFHLNGGGPIENVCDLLFYRRLPSGPRISVELHHGLLKTRDYPAIPEEKWWHQAQEVWVSGQHYFSLAPADMLMYLTIKIHDSAYCYLKQFIDLHQLLIFWGHKLDWGYIFQTAQKARILNNLFFVLFTLEHLFGPTDSFPALYRQVKPPMGSWRIHLLEHILNRQTIIRGRYGRDLRKGFCLLLNDRLADSITSTLRVFFPSTRAICARYLIMPHSKRFYLYYGLNPLLIIYWLLRGLVVKSRDGDGLGALLGPWNQK